MKTREEILREKAREIAGRFSVRHGYTPITEALVDMGRWCDANPATQNEFALTDSDIEAINVYDRCMTLEEKGLLAQIVISNKVRKPEYPIRLRELWELNPYCEPKHIDDLIDGLCRKGRLKLNDIEKNEQE